jgi:hypothetical protein
MTKELLILPEDEERIWREGGFRVFLSHKSENKREASELKGKLNQLGISCFVAHEDIEPTKEWIEEIEKALYSMDALVALITEKFHDSVWTNQEIGFALGRNVLVISLKMGGDPCGFIGKFQALSCSWDSAHIELVKRYLKHDRTLDAYIDAYIKAVKKCQHFDEANGLSEILPNITKLSDQQARDLISAFNENDQVRWSHGFSGDKPSTYGKGFEFYLNQLSKNIKYEINDFGKIEAKP